MTTIELDFPAAVQMIAAGEERVRLFEAHVNHGVDYGVVGSSIVQTMRGVHAIREAFRLPTEAELDAAHEAAVADMARLEAAAGLPDVPLAECESRAIWGDR
uniref:Uncharacterized protein n=1 Tax=viral metagenome TaxID=1070528 RepID=A0A6M3L1T3_9ZZZZ